LNSGKVKAVGPGARDRDGKLIPVIVKEGDVVLLPEYGGTEVKLGDKEYVPIPPPSLSLLLIFLPLTLLRHFFKH
jgi:co-chaperonin GroES (HSP10)